MLNVDPNAKIYLGTCDSKDEFEDEERQTSVALVYLTLPNSCNIVQGFSSWSWTQAEIDLACDSVKNPHIFQENRNLLLYKKYMYLLHYTWLDFKAIFSNWRQSFASS